MSASRPLAAADAEAPNAEGGAENGSAAAAAVCGRAALPELRREALRNGLAAGALCREALRQQMLLRVLWRDAPAAVLAGWMRDDAEAFRRGLAAYRANAGALAARALAAAYPTVAQLLGEESFMALARARWQADPPGSGDLAEWGESLADFIAGDAQLASEPYLADVARLDWAVHACERAVDDSGDAPSGLALLGSHAPARLRLQLPAGTALLRSRYPVVTIRQAHRGGGEAAFAQAREALHAGRGETALVARQGWRVVVQRCAPAAADFTAALLHGASLAAALHAAGAGFDFEAWLISALRAGRLVAVRADEPSETLP